MLSTEELKTIKEYIGKTFTVAGDKNKKKYTLGKIIPLEQIKVLYTDDNGRLQDTEYSLYSVASFIKNKVWIFSLNSQK